MTVRASRASDASPLASATSLRVRWRRGAGVVAAVAVLVAVVAVTWLWRHPTAFPEVPREVSSSSDQWPVGQPMYVGMTYPFHHREATVTLREAEAKILTNTANATVSFGVCTLNPHEAGIASVAAPDISRFCESWVSIDGQQLTSDAHSLKQLLMKVTPRQPGDVEIAGAAVTYSQGWQRGTQDIGEHVRLHVP